MSLALSLRDSNPNCLFAAYHCAITYNNRTPDQCDQIRLKISYKLVKIFGNFFCFSQKGHFKVKTAVATISAALAFYYNI